MAKFEEAVAIVLRHEGGLTTDTGGLTKFGISARAYPTLNIRDLTIEEATEIYRTDYWERSNIGSLTSQAVANKVFDLVVNLGPMQGIRLLQLALGYFLTGPIVADGKLGPFTISAAAQVGDEKLVPEIKARAANFHAGLANDPKYAPYLLGWLRRDVS